MLKRTFLWLLLVAVGACPIGHGLAAWADETAPPPFSVPEHFGAITGYSPPTVAKKTPKGFRPPLVVLIQDLHANVGVQKNIASILYRLHRINGTPTLLVCVEGASGQGDVSLLRSLPGPIRHGFEAMLLHRAYLTGAELAATEAAADWAQNTYVVFRRIEAFFVPPKTPLPVSLSPIDLWGVDDPALYRRNWQAAKRVDRLQNPALVYLRSTQDMLAAGGSPILQKHLDLLAKLLMLRLQPADYEAYLKSRSLNPHGPPVFEECLKAAEDYYAAANLRSGAMTDNLLKKMRRSGLTVLITGGFHTQQIAELLKRKGIGYLIITPRVEVLDQDQAYRARLREEE